MTRAEWTARWTTFHGKLAARIDTIRDEALEAYADIADTSPFDVAPTAALDAAVQARYLALSNKLDEAFAKVDEALDELTTATDDDVELSALAAASAHMRRQLRATETRLDREAQRCKVLGAAIVARAIEPLFRSEDPTQNCVQCGSPFDPGPIAQSTSMPCPGCGARLTVGPRPAALAWYGKGLPALAEEAALPLWLAYRDAEDHYNDHSTDATLDGHVAAAEAYHRAVFDHLVREHPSWDTAKAEQQIQGRCNQIRSMHTRFRRQA